METLQGKLIVKDTKKGTAYYVTFLVGNKSKNMLIQDSMIGFRPEDAKDGVEVTVKRDNGKILSVTINGKQKKSHPLGAPFHNPYTFIPFDKKRPERQSHTLRSADEVEKDRVSGVITMEVETLRPLMTLHPRITNLSPDGELPDGPCHYDALTIGDDVIVPATGIRGMLRNVMMIVTGGTLTNMNVNAYTCQGRDAQLGPRRFNPKNNRFVPEEVFLARVVKRGDSLHSGTIQIGLCKLVPREDLEKIFGSNIQNKRHLFVTMNGNNLQIADANTPGAWELKISGSPVNSTNKHEGLYQEDPTQKPIELPPEFWEAYSSRNANGDHPDLFNGDLVWVEPMFPEIRQITSEEQIQSIQWARYGRHGVPLKSIVPDGVHPDTLRTDKNVDWVTDLFGQVSNTGNKEIPAFAGRIRPENLVFHDAKKSVREIELAPLSVPHLGCLGFYRDPRTHMIRGYKVYRTALDTEEPWRYDVQGIFDKNVSGKEVVDFESQKMVRKASLLPPGVTGKLRIAFRGLRIEDLSLLYWVCNAVWRVGGGKPLGLGLCEPRHVRVQILNDDGSVSDMDSSQLQPNEAAKQWYDRLTLWEKTQEPVSNVRYPRACTTGNVRGGHVWFGRHAKVKMNGTQELETLNLTENLRIKLKLRQPSIAPQWLPEFDESDPENDVLYGYDVLVKTITIEDINGKKTFADSFSPDPPTEIDTSRHHENLSPNREFRKANKEQRAKE